MSSSDSPLSSLCSDTPDASQASQLLLKELDRVQRVALSTHTSARSSRTSSRTSSLHSTGHRQFIVGRPRRAYRSSSAKLDIVLACFENLRWSFKDFVRKYVETDCDPSRRYAKRHGKILREIVDDPEVREIIDGQAPPEDFDDYIQILKSEFDSLIGKPFFGRWTPDLDIQSLDFDDAFTVITENCPNYLRLYESITRNKYDRQSVEMRLKNSSFQRQCYAITAMISRHRARNTSNFLAKLIGAYLGSTGVPKNIINVIGNMGLCDAYTAVHTVMSKISTRTAAELKVLSRDPQTFIAYDNFQFSVKSRDLVQGSARPEIIHTTTGLLVKSPSMPTEGLKISDFDPSYHIPFNEFVRSPGLQRDTISREISRYFIMEAIRFVHADSMNVIFADGGMPRWPSQRLLNTRESTTMLPLGAMYRNEGTLDGNSGVHEDIYLKILGYSRSPHSKDFRERLWLVHGDQKTAEFNRTIKWEQRYSKLPFARRHWMISPAALFHTQMNYLDGISRTHYENPRGKESRATLRHDIEYWARKGISRDAKYHEIRPVVVQAFYARVLAIFYDELVKRGLLKSHGSAVDYRVDAIEAALKQLQPDTINDIIESIRTSMFTREAWLGGDNVDPEKTTTARLLQQIEQFLNFSHAITVGDIGMIERVIPWMAVYFLGTEQHKYSTEMLHLYYLSKCAKTTAMKTAIFSSMLVNQKTNASRYKPIDLCVEHFNNLLAHNVRNFRNSTHRIKEVYNAISGSTHYMAKLKQFFEGHYGCHLDGKHTKRSARDDVFSLAVSLNRNWRFWENAANTTNRFLSPNVIDLGFDLLDDKIDAFNNKVPTDRVDQDLTPFDPDAMDLDTEQPSNGVAADTSYSDHSDSAILDDSDEALLQDLTAFDEQDYEDDLYDDIVAFDAQPSDDEF